MSLSKQVALVTGASRGIGQAIAHELGRRGATVIGTATSEAGAEAISKGLSDAGIAGQGMMLNVTDGDAVTELVARVGKAMGAITILVNNAGITRDNLTLRMKDEQWSDVIDTNLSSVFRVSKACLRGMMKQRQGRIISISSVVGTSGNLGQANYAAAKAGLSGFSKSLAREVAARSITVNLVAPGFIDTDMTRALTDDQRAALLKAIPLQRLGQAEDIAKAVGFLASPDAAYITGETIHVNGGMVMG